MKTYSLNKGWKLNVLEYGEKQPFDNPINGMEIVYDEETKEFFMIDILGFTYAGESIIKRCNEVIDKLEAKKREEKKQ